MLKTHLIPLLLAAGALAGAPAVAAPHHGGGACTKTAYAARAAALRQADADLWLAIGNAYNLWDAGERWEALEEAWDEWFEARDEAKDQMEARLELCDLLGQEPYDPELDPEDFVEGVDNPFFPLNVGETRIYEGETEDGLERVEETVLDETREILDIECVVVHAVEFVDGEMIEDTYDYYAQDVEGNVWYMGELSFELEDGYVVNMDGSWIAGEDGAKAGIIMLADPMVGTVYRQEFLLGEAEDYGTVKAVGQSVDTPYAHFDGCDVILDRSPLEPDAMEDKFYAPGVGLVSETDLESGETIALVDIVTD